MRVQQIRDGDEAAMQEKIKGETKEGAKERLTEGDLQSHRTMVYGFAKAFPKLKVNYVYCILPKKGAGRSSQVISDRLDTKMRFSAFQR